MSMTLDKTAVIKTLLDIFRKTEGNTINEDIALEGCSGLQIYDAPLFGISSSDDTIYREFKRHDVIGEGFLLPGEWLDEAETVISFFMPFTERVKRSNRNSPDSTSSEWLHARIEGQAFLERFMSAVCEYFERTGIRTCAPSLDERFTVRRTETDEGNPEGLHFSSSWSERHAAFVSGLGTFSLSRSLITEKGAAGRCGSVIISGHIEPDVRPYSGLSDYCIKCGACISRCPVMAISLKHGKNQKKCSTWIDITEKKYEPRYGCGKCQTGVPCESCIPVNEK